MNVRHACTLLRLSDVHNYDVEPRLPVLLVNDSRQRRSLRSRAADRKAALQTEKLPAISISLTQDNQLPPPEWVVQNAVKNRERTAARLKREKMDLMRFKEFRSSCPSPQPMVPFSSPSASDMSPDEDLLLQKSRSSKKLLSAQKKQRREISRYQPPDSIRRANEELSGEEHPVSAGEEGDESSEEERIGKDWLNRTGDTFDAFNRTGDSFDTDAHSQHFIFDNPPPPSANKQLPGRSFRSAKSSRGSVSSSLSNRAESGGASQHRPPPKVQSAGQMLEAPNQITLEARRRSSSQENVPGRSPDFPHEASAKGALDSSPPKPLEAYPRHRTAPLPDQHEQGEAGFTAGVTVAPISMRHRSPVVTTDRSLKGPNRASPPQKPSSKPREAVDEHIFGDDHEDISQRMANVSGSGSGAGATPGLGQTPGVTPGIGTSPTLGSPARPTGPNSAPSSPGSPGSSSRSYDDTSTTSFGSADDGDDSVGEDDDDLEKIFAIKKLEIGDVPSRGAERPPPRRKFAANRKQHHRPVSLCNSPGTGAGTPEFPPPNELLSPAGRQLISETEATYGTTVVDVEGLLVDTNRVARSIDQTATEISNFHYPHDKRKQVQREAQGRLAALVDDSAVGRQYGAKRRHAQEQTQLFATEVISKIDAFQKERWQKKKAKMHTRAMEQAREDHEAQQRRWIGLRREQALAYEQQQHDYPGLVWTSAGSILSPVITSRRVRPKPSRRKSPTPFCLREQQLEAQQLQPRDHLDQPKHVKLRGRRINRPRARGSSWSRGRTSRTPGSSSHSRQQSSSGPRLTTRSSLMYHNAAPVLEVTAPETEALT
mmetsp:Transcript_27906/g.64334  ORF Transcript_27906/g.64334 Transcript_27906/m.64334 type:complete len:826 (-) Transcript_27906:10-2487(-)